MCLVNARRGTICRFVSSVCNVHRALITASLFSSPNGVMDHVTRILLYTHKRIPRRRRHCSLSLWYIVHTHACVCVCRCSLGVGHGQSPGIFTVVTLSPSSSWGGGAAAASRRAAPVSIFFGSLMDSLEGKHTSPSLHRPNLINNRVNHESPPPLIYTYLNAVAVREVKRQLLSRLADYYDTALHSIHV